MARIDTRFDRETKVPIRLRISSADRIIKIGTWQRSSETRIVERLVEKHVTSDRAARWAPLYRQHFRLDSGKGDDNDEKDREKSNNGHADTLESLLHDKE